MANFSVIIAAAGASTRFKDQHYKKPFALLNQKAVWLYSAEKFLAQKKVKQVIVVVAREDLEEFRSRFGANLAVMGIDVVAGAEHRAGSVENGLGKVDSNATHVIVHDGARPCLADEWIHAVMDEGVRTGAAILAIPVTSTLKYSEDGRTIVKTVSRDHLWQAQTPQVFEINVLRNAFSNRPANFQPTDEAQLVEQAGHPVSLVAGSPLNIKITTKADLGFAAACLKSLPTPRFDAPLHPFQDDNLWR